MIKHVERHQLTSIGAGRQCGKSEFMHKLLTFETGREEEMIYEYWYKERARLVGRCTYLLGQMYKDVSIMFQVGSCHSNLLYIASNDLHEAHRMLMDLEWKKNLRDSASWSRFDPARTGEEK